MLLQPNNHNKKYEELFVEIDTGQIKLPMFQREFVWDKEQSSKLIDSILKGFPIGTFIFWKTKEELRSYKEVGNHKLPVTQKGDYVQYILDGQQRITSLYAIRKGIRISKDGKELDYKDIFVNLDYDPENDEQIVVTDKQDGKQYVSVHDILLPAARLMLGKSSECYKRKWADWKKDANRGGSKCTSPTTSSTASNSSSGLSGTKFANAEYFE